MSSLSAQSIAATASAPGKIILFGEHAINRGQPALSAAIGLRARCTVQLGGAGIRFKSGAEQGFATCEEVFNLGRAVEGWRQRQQFEEIRALTAGDFFAPQKYILSSLFGNQLPPAMSAEWESEVPGSAGLGSGGSAFTAFVAATCALLEQVPAVEARSDWAHRGDIIAHGGIASALDSQTSLLGGVIRFTGQGMAARIECAPELPLIVAHSGVQARTSEVNTRVRQWVAENPAARQRLFETIGTLVRTAEPLLAKGEWAEVGRLMTLNHLVLQRIGVSCPELEELAAVALGAGAWGAKISGSGGGGILIVLCPPEARTQVCAALTQAGGQLYQPEIGVPGVEVNLHSEPTIYS